MANQFQDLTADDFEAAAPAEPTVATEQPVIMSKKNTPSQASIIEPSWLKRGLAGAGRSFVNKYRGLTGQGPAEGAELEEDTAGSIGGYVPDMVGSMLAPARIIPQALYGAASRGIEPAENLMERLVNAGKGGAEQGVGQAIGGTLIRGANALGGRLTREGEAALAAKGAGLNLTAGDITRNKLLQLAEEKSFRSPSKAQSDEIAAIMNTEGGDPITVAIKTAYDAAQGKVSAAATRLDDMLNTGKLPGVSPYKTYEMLQQIAKRSPDTLKNVRDPVLQQTLADIASYPAGRIPKSMSFGQLDELRKALGPVMSKVDMQAKSGASNVTTADANRWKQLYKGMMTDIEGWGSKSATEDALKAHRELRDTFKNEVLPLREHPVAGKIIDDGYTRPEDLLRDLTSNRNKSIINDLYGRVDIAGKNAFDALRMATRGTKEFVRGEPATMWSRPLTLTAGLTAPAWGPTAVGAAPWLATALLGEQAIVHGLNTPLGRMIVSASPRVAKGPLTDAAIQSGLRASAKATGEELR